MGADHGGDDRGSRRRPGPRRAARGGVREMFTLSGGHVFPLYDAAHKAGFPHLRRPARAVRGLRRRSGGQAAAPPRPGRADRRPRRHQRHLRPDQRLLQRRRRCSSSAAGRRRSAGARAACRRSTTCRWSRRSPSTPRPSSATDDIPARCATALTAALTAAPRPGLPRPAAGGRSSRTGERRRRPAHAGVDVDRARPGRGRQGRRAAGRRRSARSSSPAPTSTPGDAVAALREAAEALQRAGVHQRHGPRRAAARAPARLRQGPPGRARAAPTWSRSIGTPLDFRLGFGDFGDAQVVHIVDAPGQRASHVTPAVVARR